MISFDNIILKAFTDENKAFLTGARINKIQQPTRRELILLLRNSGESRQLYINITPQLYHICFINDESSKKRLIENPQKPPMFCMLLRKYLNNAKIAKINQPEKERILELYFETFNEIGDKIYLCLSIELMGKYSNIILYNTDTNIILGCAHNIGADKSQVREVYGQIPYTYPPKHIDDNFITQRYGFLFSFKKAIYPVGEINSIIDNYYAQLTYRKSFKRLKSEYLSIINQKIKKIQKSLKEINEQIKKYSNYNKYRLYGDLLMANLYNLKDYSETAEVFDYENNKNISISLKAAKTIKENANDFYKKYNKSKTAGTKLNELLKEYKISKEYLDSVLYSVEIAQDIEDLNELKTEIYEDKNKLKQTPNDKKISPIVIEKGNQTRIYIGKNNKQNDYIISKLASDEDLWFHTKDCPGSHVLLKAQNITDELILECAKLAKQNSQGANSSKIGVIYTKRKYLRKPPKANLGYVTYKNEKEIVID